MTLSSHLASPKALFRREDDGGVVTLTLTAPRSRNALSLAMIAALILAVDAIDEDHNRARRRARGRRPGSVGGT